MTMRNWFWFLTAALTFVLPAASHASTLGSGSYWLENHRDGGEAAPFYGLRLDGLFGGGQGEVITFDFEHPGAAMKMDLDLGEGTLRIFGRAYGGLDVGSSYAGAGFYDIDFLFTDVAAGSTITANTGSGTISGPGVPAGDVASLVAYKGHHSDAFYLGTGHRNNPGVSGWGWLNHSVGGLENHLPASDWLFEVGEAVPEPGTALMIGVGALVVVSRRATLRSRTCRRQG